LKVKELMGLAILRDYEKNMKSWRGGDRNPENGYCLHILGGLAA
jgi:hypothetical protein